MKPEHSTSTEISSLCPQLLKMATHTFLICIILSAITHNALSQVINPNPPSFQYTPYLASQPENLTINSIIFGPVVASDPDNGYSAKVSFHLMNDFNGLFNISTAIISTETFAYSANVYLKKNLDYEKVPFYKIPIMASDYYGKHVITELQLTVTDVQEAPPIFLSKLQTTVKDLATTVPDGNGDDVMHYSDSPLTPKEESPQQAN